MICCCQFKNSDDDSDEEGKKLMVKYKEIRNNYGCGIKVTVESTSDDN